MEFELTLTDMDLEAFRSEARAWLAENFPPSVAGRGDVTSRDVPYVYEGDFKLWKERAVNKGWAAPTWPREYGGGGLSANEGRILQEEMARIGAWSPLGGLGVMMLAPTLLEFGTKAQKEQHVPPIARGELNWCQGFSEPGAGSDLASLQTRAEDRGDHFLVTGQKVWTSGANYADWCFCLVRTDTKKKHDGISFLLIDMHSPGIEARPIPLIAGNSPFCETFFTDVVVPKENLVGPLNGGWTIAKRLLQHERRSLGSGRGQPRSRTGELIEAAKHYGGVDAAGRLRDTDFRARLIQHHMDSRAYDLTARRVRADAASEAGTSSAVSIMKNVSAKLLQDHTELMIETLGHSGLGWTGDPFSREERAAMRTFLRSKANSIAGGSHEIQNNIIAKRILGLPDPPGPGDTG